MKHFINILVIVILTAFAVLLTYVIHIEPAESTPNGFGILYIPLGIFMLVWGIKLNEDYK